MIFISDSGSLPRPRNGTDGIIAHRYRFADTGNARYLNTPMFHGYYIRFYRLY